MSDEGTLTAAPPAVEYPGPSWLTIIAGLSFVATLGVLAAILAVRFVQTRPVNVEAPSAELATIIEKALQDNYVPSAAITVSNTMERSDDGNRWTHNHFDVAVPERLDAKGIANLLGNELRTYNLTITHEPATGGGEELKVWLANFEIASVALKASAAAPASLSDLRTASTRLIEEARAGIESLGIDPGAIFQSLPETREDTEARWYRSSLETRSLTPLSPADTAHAIRASITFPDVEVRAGDLEKGRFPVALDYRGKPIADMVFIVPADGAPAHVEPPLDVQPDLGDILSTTVPQSAVTVPMAAPEPEGEPVPAEGEGNTEDDLSKVETPAEPEDTDAERMKLASLPTPPGPRSVEDAANPRIAIILDDGGYGGPVTERTLALNPKLTLSILPNTPHGADTATRAAQLGFEIMLHMPMETDSATVKPFPGQINVGMSTEEIASLTASAMEQVPGAVGVNNHTGSKFTADSPSMEEFLPLVSAKEWFFIDSRTGPNSRAYEVAQSLGIPSGSRDVFLDDVADAAEIRRQWAEMVRIARKSGEAIAIGHFRPLTLDVIEQELPKLEAAGIELVHASELVR